MSNELLSKLGSEEILGLAGMLVGVVAILGGISIAIVKVVTDNRRRTQRDEMKATLKLEMVQRGMSAGEIKQVLEARMGAGQKFSLGDLLNLVKPPAAPKFGPKAEQV